MIIYNYEFYEVLKCTPQISSPKGRHLNKLILHDYKICNANLQKVKF